MEKLPLAAVIYKEAFTVAEIHSAELILGHRPVLGPRVVCRRGVVADKGHRGEDVLPRKRQAQDK